MILCGFAISYLAWFGLYHASARRSDDVRFNKTKHRSRLTRLIATALLLLALWPCNSLLGIERGVPLWLALLVCAGTAFIFSLYISPRFHKALSILSLAFIPLTVIFGVLGAN